MEQAAESEKIVRAREKLSKSLREEQAQINPEALKKTAAKIRDWIAANGKDRVQVKGKNNMTLFNQNQDAAVVSKKIQEIMEALRRNNS